ncbi:MAG: radical SAM protein [Clostridia bacterium]|nr:radical SAM protein [Clostridia bacterium]
MDEIKEQNVNLQNPQGQTQGGGGKRRRRKKRKGGGGQNGQNAQNQQAQQVVEQAAQQERTKPQPQQQKQKQKQKQNKQADDGKKDTYAYVLDGNLYINLTNKCSNGCDFCVRNERASYYGHYLWLRHGEPTVDKVIAAVKQLGDLSQFKEVVFCGFGEPTYKVAEMVELCDYFHEKGLKTRLNTNGQGNLINKRDIVPEIKGKIDFVNVSLNASCAEKYQKICRSQFKEMGFDALVEFAKICRRNGVKCRFSIVDCIGEEEVEACKKLAESVKVPLYIRKYITDS